MDKKEQLKRMREEKISSKEVYKGIILDIFVDQVRLPSGNTSQREVIRHCHAAAVLAIDEKNRVLLEDQFRYPYDDIITEIPAGKGDEGEDYQITAARELEEETGYQAGKMEFLGYFYPSVGYTDEKIGIYLATELKKKKQHLDEDEVLDYYFLPMEEFEQKIRNGEICDGKTLAAYAYYKARNQ